MAAEEKLRSTYEELQKNEQKLHFYEDKRKRYQSQIKNFSRRERTHRLIERGAILEKYLPIALKLDNEELSTLLGMIFSQNVTVRTIEAFIAAHHPDGTD